MKPLIVLSGPTAVGKTDLSLKLAKKINGEIISADSMQVYIGMDIGTAKILPDEMQGVKHHLIDIISPYEEWNVMRFQKLAKAAIDEICSNDRIPIVTGGTGFYIQALLKDVEFSPETDGSVRAELEEKAENGGSDELYQELCRRDPASAAKIHRNNTKRIIRALEFIRLNGYPFSEHNKEQSGKKPPYDFAYFVLTDDRQKLYQRIDKRVDAMLEKGLIEEVKRLKMTGLDRSYVSMQGLGYKEVLDYLDGITSYEDTVAVLKRDTRHFAKRQLTWFRREEDVIMLDKSFFENDDRILESIINTLNEKGIINGIK